ncbi:TPA: hypothetical protein ACY3LK_000021 [Citrobacter braakii]
MSLWLAIPILMAVWLFSFLAGVDRGKRDVQKRIDRERDEASKLLDTDKAAALALLYQAKERAYDGEKQVFSEDWTGILRSIDELRYLWRYRDPVKWVSKSGVECED